MATTKVQSELIVDDVALAGNPTTTPQSAGNATTRIATTAFIDTAISNLIDSAPGTLNTLNEIAAALNDDPSFTTTVNNAIATKLPLAGGTLTGGLQAPNIWVDDDITHTGDSDTYLSWNADNLSIYNGGVQNAYLSPGYTVFNEGGGDVDFRVESNNNANMLFVDGGNDRVGIGTLSPDYLLDVSKSNVGGVTDMRVFNEATSNAASGTRSIISVTNANVGDPRLVLAVAGVKEYSLGIDNSDGDKFKINNGSDPSGGTNYLTIDSGNVGIGTASPSAILEVAGIGWINPADGTHSGWNFRQGDTFKGWVGYNDSTDVVNLSMDGSIAAGINVNSSGNVGIGTTGPDTKLTIKGTSHESINIRAGDGYNATLAFSDASGNWYESYIRYHTDTNDMSFAVNGDEKMRILDTGEVGIGTTNPAGKLHVDGLTGSVATILEGNGNGDEVPLFFRTKANNGNVTNHGIWGKAGSTGSDNFLNIGPTSSAGIQVNSDGDVSIGGGTLAHLGLAGTGGGSLLSIGGDDAQIRMANQVIHADNTGYTTFYLRNNYGATHAGAHLRLDSGYITMNVGTSFTETVKVEAAQTTVTGRFDVNQNAASNFIAKFDQNSSTGYGLAVDSMSEHLVFWYKNGSNLGAVSESGGNVVYGGTSDYRLKENVKYDFDATTELKKLKPIEFNFTAFADSKQNGFLAHELQEVVPKAVVGEKDAVDDEGSPIYQNVDPAKLVPLLVKTIQELEARIAALEA